MLSSVLAIAGFLLLAGGYYFYTCVRMPGSIHHGQLPPLTVEEADLEPRLRAHVEMLAGTIGARSLTFSPDGLERSANYIERTLRSIGYQPTFQEFEVSEPTALSKKTRNIIAELPGETDEYVDLVAHYDGVYDCPAANDNATGVAALLELARLFFRTKGLKPTIRFVFVTNEEPPFFRTEDMGSRRYAKLCKQRGDNIVAMYSLETMGYYSSEPGSQGLESLKPLDSFFPSVGNFITFVGNLRSRQHVRQSVEQFRCSCHFPAEGIAAPASVPGVDFSDQQGFWDEGYPGIMVTDTAFLRYKHYHTNEDTPDKVQYDNLARVTSGFRSMLLKLIQ